VDFWMRLAHVRDRHNVLKHPFYLRWSAGELGADELADYAGQYRHAVVALAEATATAAVSVDAHHDVKLRAMLDEHASEEAEHIPLWDDFCGAVGRSQTAAPLPETLVCARTWAGDDKRPLLCSLVALHAIEAGQPAISATKRAGLVAHYAVRDGAATAYFELHERLDVEHANTSRRLIEERLAGVDTHQVDAFVAEAEAVLRANWLLLDGVEHAASSGRSSVGFEAPLPFARAVKRQ
jgi:pyrroloquinoline-quinone synthase